MEAVRQQLVIDTTTPNQPIVKKVKKTAKKRNGNGNLDSEDEVSIDKRYDGSRTTASEEEETSWFAKLPEAEIFCEKDLSERFRVDGRGCTADDSHYTSDRQS